ncbi:hypothetical protein LptCag_0415 [Leptospirillum ferriphilum]|uniref:Uncharacterized protein n=1 Tax=Leptospirillum ferriphilum TaxID=178606 RepID=A0A094X477_9BACT|nr:hypothetical protein LptCag_0415 [Leptospirillum ferriphilum]
MGEYFFQPEKSRDRSEGDFFVIYSRSKEVPEGRGLPT